MGHLHRAHVTALARTRMTLAAALAVCILLSPSAIGTTHVQAEDPPARIGGWGTSGTGDGEFNLPGGIAVDADGNVYVADRNNDRIQKFDADGTYLLQWGSYATSGEGFFNKPSGVAVDSEGNVYVADTNNHRIQKFNSSGGFLDEWGSFGITDGLFRYPVGLTVNGDDVYVADYEGHRIQKFDTAGTYLLQWGSQGSDDGEFIYPVGAVVDLDGNVLVSDYGNNRVQKFSDTGGYLSQWGSAGSDDGEFQSPVGLAVDTYGDLYVTDSQNHRIQKFDTSGTFISKWGTAGQDDGEFSGPGGVAISSGDTIYISDTYNNRIQVFAYAIAVNLDLTVGWNMVSVPVEASDMSVGSVFPGVAAVYTWDPVLKSYSAPTTIEVGAGYWVASTTERTISVTGTPVEEWTRGLSTGWNMIGSVYGDPVDVADADEFVDDPSGTVQTSAIYTWNPTAKSYQVAIEIEQGMGYWAACSGDCDLTVTAPA